MIRNRSPRGVTPGTPVSAHAAARRPHRATRRAARGFTLVELMVTLAVAATLMAIAIPSFRHITLSNRLSTTANKLVTAINQARMEAVKTNDFAQFCSNVAANNGTDILGTTCGANTGAVAVLQAPDTAASQPTGSIAQAAIDPVTTPLTLSGSTSGSGMQALRFDGMGIAHAIGSTAPFDGVVAVVKTTALSSGNCRILKMSAGSIITIENTDSTVSGCN